MMDKGTESIAECLSPPNAGIRSLETNTSNGACHFATFLKSKSHSRGLTHNFTPVSKFLFWRKRRSQSAGHFSNVEVPLSPVYGDEPARATENGSGGIPVLRTASSSTPTVSPVSFIGDEATPSPVQSMVDESVASRSHVSFIENETMPHGCTFDSSFITSICATPTPPRVAGSLPYMGVTGTDVGPVVDQDGSASETSCNDLQNRTFTSPLNSTLETESQSVLGGKRIVFEIPVSDVHQNTFDVDSPSSVISQTTSCKNDTFDAPQLCPTNCNGAESEAKTALLHNTFEAEPEGEEAPEAGPHSDAIQTTSLGALSSTITLPESAVSVHLQKTFDMVSPNELATSRKNYTFEVNQPCPSKRNITTDEAQPNAKKSRLDSTFDAEPDTVTVEVSEAEPSVVTVSEVRAGSDVVMDPELCAGSDVVMVSEDRAISDVVMVSDASAGSEVVAPPPAAFAAVPNATLTVCESGSSGCSGDTHSSTLTNSFLNSPSQTLARHLNETLDLREFLPSTSTPQVPHVNKLIMKQETGKSSVVQRKPDEPGTLLAPPPTNLVGDRKTFLPHPGTRRLLPPSCAASKLLKCGTASIPGLVKRPHFGLKPHSGLHRRTTHAGLEVPRNTAVPLEGATGVSRSIVTPSAESAVTAVSARSKVPGAGLRRPCPSGLPGAAFRPPLTRSVTANELTGMTGQTRTAVPALRTGRGSFDLGNRHIPGSTDRDPLPGAKKKNIGCANCAQMEMQLAASRQENKRLQEELHKLREEKAGWKGKK